MKKREITRLITIALATSVVLGNVQVVKATESNTQVVSVSELSEGKAESIYLSDIEYDATLSAAGWGSIKKDVNIEGRRIKLKVDNEVVEFKKGMAAHATSTLVYNVSEYKKQYNRLTTYAGIDSSKNGLGNGVKISVYTSNDGSNWTLVDDFGVVASNANAVFIDVNISGANYVKLYAHDNGSNGYDHVVYGDAKLVNKDYSDNEISSSILKEVSEYDEILSNASIEENLSENEGVILKRDFVSKIGSGTLRRLAASNPAYKNAIEYLLTNEDALRYYVTGGAVNINGNYVDTIKFFSDIYEKHGEEFKDSSDDNFNLRLAISISLAYAHYDLTTSWIGGTRNRDAVKRYEIYQELISSGRMDEAGYTEDYGKWSSRQFKELPVALMRWTVDNRMNDDEILWLADYALEKKAKTNDDYLSAYSYIKYTTGYKYDRENLYQEENKLDYNDKYSFMPYFDDYGTANKYRMWMVFEEGSVCGGLAKTYSNLADTFGRPSSVVAQPGHAATITYGWSKQNQRYEWMLQNDISGWTGSGNEYNDRLLRWGNDDFNHWQSASYTVLATDAILNKNFTKVYELNILAEALKDNDKKKEAYEKALELQGINYDSMKGLISTYKADDTKTSKDYLELARRICNNFTYYPQAMEELLSLIKANITGNDLIELDMIENTALTKASKAIPEVSTNVTMSKQMASKYLGTANSALADFSFDGENAGKIIINSKYDESEIRVRYSLDGGNNWVETDKHSIELTNEEIESITAVNDIKVGLVGSNEVYTIDITEGRAMSNSIVYKNDIENLFFGEVDNIQVSTDNCVTWRDYSEILASGERFDGYMVTHVRFKPTGKSTYSQPGRYTFNNDTNNDKRKYIQFKNINFVGVSSYRDNNDRYKGQNLVDGNANTEWQTQYGDSEKSITVEFDKVRYLTSLEYTTTSQYGRLKSGKILTSLDGNTWEVASVFTNLENTNRNKTINLSVPTAAKYVKLIADETYAGNESDLNKVLSGNLLSFFEDSTLTYIPEVKVEEVTEEGSNEEINNSEVNNIESIQE